MEIWKDVVGYEGAYLVSNLGNVKSVDRVVTSRRGSYYRKGKMLARHIDKLGYEYTHLSKDAKGRNIKVHRIVAEAFCERRDGARVVHHKDGSRDNNIADNLEWATHKENTKHAIDSGTWKNIGENARDAILKESQVLEIRNDKTRSYRELASAYGVSRPTIADIKHFRSWKQLGGKNLFDITPEIKKAFPLRLKSIRKNAGLNKGAFALELGYERSTIARWESGTSFPMDKTLIDLMEKLSIDFINC